MDKLNETPWKTQVLRMLLTLDPSTDRRIHVSSIHHSAVLLKRAWSCWSIVDLALNLRWNRHESATFHRNIIFQTFSRHLPDLILGLQRAPSWTHRGFRTGFRDIFPHGLSSEESSYWLSNWWYTYPSEKYEFVSWVIIPYYSQYMEK